MYQSLSLLWWNTKTYEECLFEIKVPKGDPIIVATGTEQEVDRWHLYLPIENCDMKVGLGY